MLVLYTKHTTLPNSHNDHLFIITLIKKDEKVNTI